MTFASRYRLFQQLHAKFFYAGSPPEDECRARTRLYLLIFVGVALTICASVASSAPAVPKMEIFPTQLSLQVGETEEGWVKIINESAKDIDVHDLRPTAPKGVQVQFVPILIFPQSLPPGGEMSARFTVVASKEEPPKDPVYFVATYQAEKGQGRAFAELKLEARQPTDISKLASLELSAATPALDELHNGIIYLTVKNISGRPINLDCPEITHPKSIKKVDVRLPSKSQNPQISQSSSNICGKGMPLLPGENHVFELLIETEDAAMAGNYPLVILLKLHWKDGDQRVSGTLTTSHMVELSVFGESVILHAFAIPSFLVLPGFLILGTWLGCRRLLIAGATEVPTREFWILAISLSIVTAKAYPFLTEILTPHKRDYLQGYGLIDLVYVWTGSIFFGLIFALTMFLVWPFLRHRYYEPQLDDTPEIALCKAKRSCASLAPVRVDKANANYFVYREKGNLIWIAPRINYVWTGNNQDNLATFDQELKAAKKKFNFTCLCGLLTNSCYATALSKSVVNALRSSSITVTWDGDNTSKRGPLGPFNRTDVQFLPDSLPPILMS